jgi:hypothetical protein
MRELTDVERANLAFLTSYDVPFGVLEITATGLDKAILDATEPFRNFLEAQGIHDFARQLQGQAFKQLREAVAISVDGQLYPSAASLYRPETKNGDPRVWFKNLRLVVAPSQLALVVWADSRFTVFNGTTIDIAEWASRSGSLKDLLEPYVNRKTSVVETLLSKMRAIARKGYIVAPVRGSTAVGRLLESELGIAMNSRHEPDFEGIEIKASRAKASRVNLFAKTPDWGASPFGSSRALLAEFGYAREDRRKLYCEIDGRRPNSLGFVLEVDGKSDTLRAVHYADKIRVVTVWELEALRHSLVTKHDETFWVRAGTKILDEVEYIRFEGITHTRKPIILQLEPLLANGTISLDYTISSDSSGKVHDKGYLFKIWPKNLELLFPPALTYALPFSDDFSDPLVGGTVAPRSNPDHLW